MAINCLYPQFKIFTKSKYSPTDRVGRDNRVLVVYTPIYRRRQYNKTENHQPLQPANETHLNIFRKWLLPQARKLHAVLTSIDNSINTCAEQLLQKLHSHSLSFPICVVHIKHSLLYYILYDATLWLFFYSSFYQV